MSSPPLKAPPILRWLSVVVVVIAFIVRFWPHPPSSRPVPVPPPTGVASASRVDTAAPARASDAAAAAGRRWTADIGFRSRERLVEHFRKHGGEFHAASPAEYLRMAQALRDAPGSGSVLEQVRGDGVICRFDRGSGAFIAFGDDGVIRTFFHPNDGERYFERQAHRPHDGP
jgi:hypothetical protein